MISPGSGDTVRTPLEEAADASEVRLAPAAGFREVNLPRVQSQMEALGGSLLSAIHEADNTLGCLAGALDRNEVPAVGKHFKLRARD